MRSSKGRKSITEGTLSSSQICNDKEEQVEEGIRVKEEQNTHITAIDSATIMDIVARLPVRSILSCRCVCSPWRSVTSYSYFTKMYRERACTTCIAINIGYDFYLLELDDNYDHTSPGNMLKRLNTNFAQDSLTLQLVGSCNGLLCFSSIFGTSFYIINPILGEFIVLSLSKDDHKTVFSIAFGLGFSEASGQYKVLKVVIRFEDGQKTPSTRSEGEVCTLGIGTWRHLGEIPIPDDGKFGDAYLEGALHYISYSADVTYELFSFDFEEEKLQSIPPPRALEVTAVPVSLGVLRNCLCILECSSEQDGFNMWSMKEYGVAESWMKECIFNTSIPRTGLQPITVWKDTEILVYFGGVLSSYNPIVKRSRKIEMPGFPAHQETGGPLSAFSFTANFLSLSNVVRDGVRYI